MNSRFVFAAVASLMLVACGGTQQEPQTEKPATQEQSLGGKKGEPCGTNTCGQGEYCCNASCGICAPEGGFCTQQVCEPTVGEPCGTNTCGTGEFCCNSSCGICAPVGGFCTQQVCEPAPVVEAVVAPTSEASLGQPCGNNRCGSGEFCCNESCGICAPKGGSCTQQVCTDPLVKAEPTEESFGQPCGSSVCGSGEFCCNESCGICAPKGGGCTQQFCG
jgi:hypothetical protein